jgi:signal peptidase I
MSYRVLPFFSKAEEKVGVYLQYLPGDHLRTSDTDHRPSPVARAVDVSFGLRMVGRQRTGPRFDVEFRSGMRFVSNQSDASLQEGRARDFGSHLMQTSLLEEFLGIDDAFSERDSAPVQLQVSILVHNVIGEGLQREEGHPPLKFWSGRLASLVPRDVRGQNREGQHDSSMVRTGKVVVPVLTELAQRPRMFEVGAYPGVEFRIMRVLDPQTGQDVFYSRPGAEYEMRPLYPLVQQLERQWPVRVNEKDLPRLYTAAMYNTISALASLLTGVAGLLAAFCVSQAVSLFFIPSHSMEPTLEVGDVLLVDKVTPRLFRGACSQVGNVVLFHPPQKLQEIVSRSSGGGRQLSHRDLFVKRVAAVAGDVVTVKANGDVLVNDRDDGRNRNVCTGPGVDSYIEPVYLKLVPGQVAVLGDCARVSLDSRVWGPLPSENIVGRPLLRLWPISRFGSVPILPSKDL